MKGLKWQKMVVVATPVAVAAPAAVVVPAASVENEEMGST